MVGTLETHRDGFGFVCPDTPGGEDIYIRPRDLAGAWHGDRVVAVIERVRRRGRREGRIVRILERRRKEVVGRYEQLGERLRVVPLEERLSHPIWVQGVEGVEPGQIVVAEVTHYPDKGGIAEGRIVSVLGDINHPDVEIAVIAHEQGLPLQFSAQTMTEADNVPQKVSRKDLQGREDLRSIPFVTIDGENARDFDDAVAVRPEGSQIRLWVTIADVSHYVPSESAIDREAYARGTSVYFPDRAIHMLPPKLSTGICSLKPNVDRLGMTAEMLFDTQGRLKKYRLYPSAIRSRARLTYTEVRQILVDRDEKVREKYRDLVPNLEWMERLAEKLRNQRQKRGSIDFDLPEPEILLDIKGRPENIIKAERNVAHRIIEEFMLAANETVASHMMHFQIPSLYRIHEEPDPSKVKSFLLFLRALGVKVGEKKGKIDPKMFQRIVAAVEGKPFEQTVNLLLLRTMRQARYSAENSGHFGLAAENYTHFTSPIRRYPDLIVHRLLKQSSQMSAQEKKRWRERLPEIAEHTSKRERVAVEAERKMVDLKKVQFMVDKLGQIYEGYISGVASFGLFVELKDLFVEGLVHIRSLPNDHYTFVEDYQILKGKRFGKEFRLGDPVTIQVARVDVVRHQIDFDLVKY